MLLAAMLAMVLAAAVPAFAQDAEVGEDGVATGGDVQYVDCSQVQAAVQGQYGDAGAAADDESIAAAANNLGISQSQVNACLGEINAGGNGTVYADDDGGTVYADDDGGTVYAADDGGSAAAAEGGSAAAAAAATETLPETGGASLLALGAGALLVAGGLLARRIVR